MKLFCDLSSFPINISDGTPACIICGAGDFTVGEPDFAPGEHDLVIAADGGYLHLKEAGVRCDLFMGDRDSLPERTVIGEETKLYNPIKDDTDTMLAVKYGMERGYRRFFLFGVTGGRFDHTLAAMQAVMYIANRGCEGYMFGLLNGKLGSYTTAVRCGELNFPPTAKGYLSLYAFDGVARGITLENLFYPLKDGEMVPDTALGVSNAFLPGKGARVSVSDGLLVCVKAFV